MATTLQPIQTGLFLIPTTPIPYVTTNGGASSNVQNSLGHLLLQLQLLTQLQCKEPVSLLEEEKSKWHVREEELKNISYTVKQKKKEAMGTVLELLFSNQYLRNITCSMTTSCAVQSQEKTDALSKDLKSEEIKRSDFEEKISSGMHSNEAKLREIEEKLIAQKEKLIEAKLQIWTLEQEIGKCETKVCSKNVVPKDDVPQTEKLKEFFTYLTQYDLDVNSSISENIWKPLHLAAALGDPTVTEVILNLGVDVDALDVSQNTPLILASMRGKLPIVKMLMDRFANIHLKDEYGYSALHKAAFGGHADIVRELLLHGGLAVNVPNELGYYPLHLAAHFNHTETVTALLESNVPVDSKDNGDNTPLHRAASRGNLQIVKLLVLQGADIESVNKQNKTPIDLASNGNHLDVVNFLKKSLVN
ncbi:histone-lysine N-methyltransferase EHMT2-like [Periplaneta americana]|uniref:histone-lysine N-methyltransferase EHMT2-like n=1 Tax=Periplaneta americana TaxID=6978 RepID=UPI0037E931F6